jgi:putative addiction module component (TIGR02574 family)
MSNEQILKEALRLPPSKRAKLAEKLLDSLNAPGQDELDAAWADEAEERIDALDAGKISTIPADRVLKELRAKRKRR